MAHEELYWKQRAKAFWLAEGDPNSKFFHPYATKRKKINHVTKLRNDEGTLVDDHEGMCSIVEEYFVNLFGTEGRAQDSILGNNDTVISEAQNSKLTEDYL